MSAPNFGAGFSITGNATGGGFGANAARCTSGLNPFSGAAVSEDCIAAIKADLKETAVMQQTVFEANAQGALFALPAGEVRTAVGATYRGNDYYFREDTLKERIGVGPGQLSLNAVFNYLITLKSSPFVSGIPEGSQTPFFEYADTFRAPDSGLSASGAYRWKLLTNVNYSIGRAGIGVQWQHLPSIRSGSTNTGYPSYDVFNVNSSYEITEDIRIRFGIDNLLDEAPVFGNSNPLANPAFFQLPGGGLNTNNYDALGRRYYLGANLRF